MKELLEFPDRLLILFLAVTEELLNRMEEESLVYILLFSGLESSYSPYRPLKWGDIYPFA